MSGDQAATRCKNRRHLGYNAYREICGLPRAIDFDDLIETMGEEAASRFKRVYTSVDDIDLFR